MLGTERFSAAAIARNFVGAKTLTRSRSRLRRIAADYGGGLHLCKHKGLRWGLGGQNREGLGQLRSRNGNHHAITTSQWSGVCNSNEGRRHSMTGAERLKGRRRWDCERRRRRVNCAAAATTPLRGHADFRPGRYVAAVSASKEPNPQFTNSPRQNHYPTPELRVRCSLTENSNGDSAPVATANKTGKDYERN